VAVTVNNTFQFEQTLRKLAASETMAGLGAVAGKFAHNLKNHISAIKAIAKYQVKVDDPQTKQKIDRIIAVADQMMVEVKDFMQPMTGWPETRVDLDATLRELIEEVGKKLSIRQQSGELKTNIIIKHEPLDYPILVNTNKGQLRYIFSNLIENAIWAIDEKGAPQGGILLKTSVHRVREADWVTVAVEHTGKGILPENGERIFELSYTTRSEGQSGGYGLFWVRLNVERMGGTIMASTQPGNGTVFLVRLPCLAGFDNPTV
jgi:signal transduction histidine kinase